MFQQLSLMPLGGATSLNLPLTSTEWDGGLLLPKHGATARSNAHRTTGVLVKVCI